MPIWIHGDYDDLDAELDRIENMPDFKMNTYLDAVLTQGHLNAMAGTHVITGSLKASMKKDSEERGAQWIGRIIAGGASTGINNPVDYAIYEKARRGDHDFFGNLHLLNSMYIKAILKGLSK